jgi:signal transduction histidine kinase
LSHDLKTPLSSVLGYLETWKIQNPLSDPLIDVAYRNGNKLSEQLHSLLDSAKQDNPLPTYQYASIDFNTLMTECLEIMQSQYVQKGVELEVNLPDGIKAVGDSHLLERLILNLLDNALRHSPTGTAVSLSVDLEPDSKRVRVVIHNEVEREAPNGSLGIGTKIAQSILMLHHSVLETTKAENSFQQSFYLPSV